MGYGNCGAPAWLQVGAPEIKALREFLRGQLMQKR